jgi:molecular chaperone DnaK (HSP70)
MGSVIGIKVANGEFYPVLEEGSVAKKRLILTTVHDGQRSMQIDLYKSALRTMADSAYIGSLVVERIRPKPKGDPSVELTIASDGNGGISAEALDLDPQNGGEKLTLSVSLQALEDDRTYDIPDFDLEPGGTPPKGLYDAENSVEEVASKKRGIPIVPILIGAIIILALALGAWILFGRGAEQEAARIGPMENTQKATAAAQEPTKTAQTAQTAEPTAAEASKGTIGTKTTDTSKEAQPQAKTVASSAARTAAPPDADRTRKADNAKSYKVPQTIPAEGVRYKIRWGDTLWDISEAFYRNPWKYTAIARFNKIRNPDFIVSGTYIRIPPP